MEQILLVEGKNDEHIFGQIVNKHDIEKTFEVENKEGDNLYISLPIYLKTDYQTIGIVVDADENINSKWDKLKNIFIKNGYEIPAKPQKNGAIIEHTKLPKIGIWIMPDNNEKGMLEDFVAELIPNDDILINYVDQSLEVIENDNVNKYKQIHHSKARIHTWLAWQKSPGTPMGLAIKKTYLNTNKDVCLLFINWINRLFNHKKL